MKGFHIPLATILGLATIAYGQSHQPKIPADYPYCPAAVVSTNDGIHRELRVFPFSGKAFTIPVRALSAATISPDGRALYGACTPYRDQEKDGDPIRIAACKLDLYTGATTTLSGTVRDLGRDRANPPPQVAQVLALLPDGNLTFISLPWDGQPWQDFSLSLDGERAVGIHDRRLQLIDLVHGTTRPLGDELFIAAWSPDGKWLACVENGENGRTILMDAATLSPQRVLGNSELDWSPDSHYLLGMKRSDGCIFTEAGTLEAIDIQSGKRTTIRSSRCQVDTATTGWVRCDISRR
jgi:WD40 repeat protein